MYGSDYDSTISCNQNPGCQPTSQPASNTALAAQPTSQAKPSQQPASQPASQTSQQVAKPPANPIFFPYVNRCFRSPIFDFFPYVNEVLKQPVFNDSYTLLHYFRTQKRMTFAPQKLEFRGRFLSRFFGLCAGWLVAWMAGWLLAWTAGWLGGCWPGRLAAGFVQNCTRMKANISGHCNIQTQTR